MTQTVRAFDGQDGVCDNANHGLGCAFNSDISFLIMLNTTASLAAAGSFANYESMVPGGSVQ
jgi:hypothetical protein